MQQVRQTHLPLLDLLPDHSLSLLGLGEILRQALCPRDERRGVLTLALGHSDGLGVGIALRAQAIELYLQGLALVFESSQGFHIERNAAPRKIAGDGFGI